MSKSGIKGVYWNKSNASWVVRIKDENGKEKYIGCYKDIEEAKQALIDNGKNVLLANGSQYDINIDYFKTIDSEEKAYWLGFICADGSIYYSGGNETLTLSFAQNNKYFVQRFVDDVGFTGSINTYTSSAYRNTIMYRVLIYVREFIENIISSGKTIGKKNLDKIPQSIPKEYVKDFIRGYFEGDGSVYKNNANNCISLQFSGYKGLLEEFASHLDKSCEKNICGIYKDKSIFSLVINGKNTEWFFDYIYYNDNFSSFKLNKYKELIK